MSNMFDPSRLTLLFVCQ